MIVHISAALQVGSTAYVNVDIGVRTGAVGGNITVECPFHISGKTKLFCRNGCKDGNVETSSVSYKRGRYSIEFKEVNYPASPPIIYVSITNLTTSDSGRYSCELRRDLSPDSSRKFEIRVKDGEFLLK